MVSASARNKAPERVTFRDAARSIAIVEAENHSISSNRIVEIGE
jgi:hypothetical protein